MNDYKYIYNKQTKGDIVMDNVEALSKIYDQWCKVNNMPKHENGNYYSSDDIMLDHYQDMPFEPTTKQVEFLSAFGKVWDEVAHSEKR